MDGGRFRSAEDQGYVRATATMNSKSSNDIRWSVRLTDGGWICLGIASNELTQNEQYHKQHINLKDENAIGYFPYTGMIRRGRTAKKTMPTNVKYGDEIHFRFQPKMKKFFIAFVSQLF